MLFVFSVCAFITNIMIYYAKKMGFYHLNKREEEKNASFLQTFIAFSAYFVLAPISIAFVLGIFMGLKLLDNDSFLLIFPICYYTIGVFVLCLFSSSNIFKNSPQFSLKNFSKGALSWFFIYPQMAILGASIYYISSYIFDAPVVAQTVISQIKDSKNENLLLNIVVVVSVGVLIPICEEILFRGYLQTFFRRFFSRGISIGFASIIFALFHYESSLGTSNIKVISMLFLFSLYLGFMYEKWKTIAAPIGFHLIHNLMTILISRAFS